MHRKDPFEPGLCFINVLNTGFTVMILYFVFQFLFDILKVYEKSRSVSPSEISTIIICKLQLFLYFKVPLPPSGIHNFNDIFFINRTQKWMGLGEWIRLCLWKIRGSQVAHSYDNMHRMKSIMGLLHLAAGFLSPNVTKNGMLSHPCGTRTKTRTNNVKIFTTSSNFSHSLQGFSFTSAHQIPMLSTDGPILECSYSKVSWPYFSQLSFPHANLYHHSF